MYFDRHAKFSAWQEILTSIKTCMVFPSEWPHVANNSFENLIRKVNPTVEPIPPIWAGAQGSAYTAKVGFKTAEALHIWNDIHYCLWQAFPSTRFDALSDWQAESSDTDGFGHKSEAVFCIPVAEAAFHVLVPLLCHRKAWMGCSQKNALEA